MVLNKELKPVVSKLGSENKSAEGEIKPVISAAVAEARVDKAEEVEEIEVDKRELIWSRCSLKFKMSLNLLLLLLFLWFKALENGEVLPVENEEGVVDCNNSDADADVDVEVVFVVIEFEDFWIFEF